jgi:adenine/guanine phosphoribosyltransferase-like PRPP-binding protein
MATAPNHLLRVILGAMPRYKPVLVHANYLRYLMPVNELRKSVEAAVRVLGRKRFDSIAFRGMSGALIAPAVAVRLKKSLILVRKKKDDSHGGRDVEGNKASRRYVIIDDFISSGDTVCEIKKNIKAFAPNATCIGTLEINRLRDSVTKTLSQRFNK